MYIPAEALGRFWANVDRTGECWLWTGSHDPDGYGQLMINYKTLRAHRVSKEIHGDPIPSDMISRHLCNTRACVRPDHIIAGTQKQNIEDQLRAGTHSKLKYSQALVDLIRFQYALGGVTTRSLAVEHGVSKSQVHAIVSGATRTVQTLDRSGEKDPR